MLWALVWVGLRESELRESGRNPVVPSILPEQCYSAARKPTLGLQTLTHTHDDHPSDLEHTRFTAREATMESTPIERKEGQVESALRGTTRALELLFCLLRRFSLRLLSCTGAA